MALKSDGTVWTWGESANFSNNSNVPVQVSGLSGITAIAAGNLHGLALRSDGTVWEMGRTWADNLLEGTGVTISPSTRQVSGLTGINAIYCGDNYCLALRRPHLFDLNQDGFDDLLWQNNVTGDVSVWYMNGAVYTGNWDYLGRSIPTQWKIAGALDLNGDGKTDLLWQNNLTGDLTYWLMDGTRQIDTGYIAHNIPVQWKIVGIADLNGDGKSDLIWQNTQTGDVTVWYMNGAVWTGNYDYLAHGVPTAWKIVGTADLNGDGLSDLIWQNTLTGDVTVWYMNGAQWTGQWDYIAMGVPLNWKIAAMMDTNNDSKPDLIWQNTQTGDVTVWYMNGAVNIGWDYIAHDIPTDWKIVPTH